MKIRTLSLRSTFILGAAPTPQTGAMLRSANGLPPDAELSMQVFEVEIDNTIRYCCWSGGDLISDPASIGGIMPHLTPVGAAACEALLRLPYLYGPDGKFLYTLVFHGVKLGKTPLRDKIMAAFRMTADVQAVICFVGDLAGELDGKMDEALNINREKMITIDEVAGMARRVVP